MISYSSYLFLRVRTAAAGVFNRRRGGKGKGVGRKAGMVIFFVRVKFFFCSDFNFKQCGGVKNNRLVYDLILFLSPVCRPLKANARYRNNVLDEDKKKEKKKEPISFFLRLCGVI